MSLRWPFGSSNVPGLLASPFPDGVEGSDTPAGSGWRCAVSQLGEHAREGSQGIDPQTLPIPTSHSSPPGQHTEALSAQTVPAAKAYTSQPAPLHLNSRWLTDVQANPGDLIPVEWSSGHYVIRLLRPMPRGEFSMISPVRTWRVECPDTHWEPLREVTPNVSTALSGDRFGPSL